MSLSITTRKAWPQHLGLHCAWALAVAELGSAGPAPFLNLDHWVLQALFLLAPLGVYSLGGLVFDLILARTKTPSVLRCLPIAGAAWFAWQAIRMSVPTLNSPMAWIVLVAGVVGAVLLVVRGFSIHGRPALGTQYAGWALSILGCGGLALFLLIPRDVEARAPLATRANGPNVVLITWDAVRADVLPIYGGRGIETPNLDAFAARSTVFDDMSAVAPITSPTHASIITGVVPPTHAIRSNGPYFMTNNITTMAELFSEQGFATGGFVSAFPVRGEIGFKRGFDVFDDRFPLDRINTLRAIGTRNFLWLRPLMKLRGILNEPNLDGEKLLTRTDDFLKKEQGPFFMWTHFFDAHSPYFPAPSYREQALSMREQAWPKPVAEEECGDVMMLYRAEIMELDRMLGELLLQLETKDPGLQNTVIFLIADHGHCFGEGGFMDEHKPSMQEATQHIPGLLYLPQQSARRSIFPANQIDVLPTLAHAAGIAPSKEAQGVDLTPIARGEVENPRRGIFKDGFYMEAFQFYLAGAEAQSHLRENSKRRGSDSKESSDLRKRALRGGGWKYVEVLNGNRFLYNLNDVDELGQAGAIDVKDEFPAVFLDYQKRFEEMVGLIPEAKQIIGATTELGNDMLKELGYLGETQPN
jgi:arylsulfatase A-like enzyme